MKKVVIVQARMTSTRLPGKVLMDLRGSTVLAHVLGRCAAIPGIQAVCCAVPEGSLHDAVAREAEAAGAVVYRGAEFDVLDRYLQAARLLEADLVLRVTSDCPLIDPQVCAHVIDLLVRTNADYACNNMPPSWPHGLDCEAFTMAALERAARTASAPDEREHVTPWLRKTPGIARANLTGPGGWAAEQRWTIDFAEDLDFCNALLAAAPAAETPPSTDLLIALLRAHPEIAAINAQHHNVSRPSLSPATKE